MGKQAFNHVLSLLPEGQTWAANKMSYISSAYTVPQNKRLVCRIAIPDHATFRIMHCFNNPHLGDLGEGLVQFSYEINGIFNLQPDQVKKYGIMNSTSNEYVPDGLITPVLIVKSGAIINIKLFNIGSSDYLFQSTNEQSFFNNNRITIENFAYINGFLEDDI